ncbi:hypothetical protein [Mucilaginibacter kameinonensis]|uniref:hypothetical protein n=1 Tax=Mucilaginibacter kameinonensis TaxID=452286 RepID=UPI000EF7A805|nr:hypothetical protein [Mucilaginibacter kameinonensis]
MGALVYEPDNSPFDSQEVIDLDHLASQTEEILQGSFEKVLKELLVLNGSSAGARPKALNAVIDDRKQIVHAAERLTEGFEPWLVKFPNTQGGQVAEAIDYVYE